jgi:uncharacterized protein (TIGR02599 family)
VAMTTRHQLPPVIDITFVAVDEVSFNTFCKREGIETADNDPEFVDKDAFKKTEDFRKDLKALEDKLLEKKIDYRVFNTSLRIRESKWTDKEQEQNP